MLNVAGSMSTKTGVAPRCEIGSAVAMNVCAVVMTSSPGPTPHACSARWRADVPEATPTAPLAPSVRGEGGLERLDLLAEDEAGVVERRAGSRHRFRA